LRADRDHWRANAESWKVDSAAAHAQLQCARERADRAHRMEREQHEQIQAVRAALVAAGHGAELCGYTPAQVVETLAGRVKAAEQARDRQGEAIKAAHRILDEAGEARSHQRGLAEWALAQRSSMERARKAVDG